MGEKEGRGAWARGGRLSEEGAGGGGGPLRQRARVAGSPGARLSGCSQLRSPGASWTLAGGHGQGSPPDAHRAPFEEMAAVGLDPSLLAVALPAPCSNALRSAGLQKRRWVCNWQTPFKGGRGGETCLGDPEGTPAPQSWHQDLGLRAGLNLALSCTSSTPLLAGGHCQESLPDRPRERQGSPTSWGRRLESLLSPSGRPANGGFCSLGSWGPI